MNKEVERIIKKIEELDWNVSVVDENVVELSICSPAMQDFNISVDTEDDKDLFIDNIYERYSNFDVSYETYLWLDDEGHGVNGAPYDMKDLYEDMEWCQYAILELYRGLNTRGVRYA